MIVAGITSMPGARGTRFGVNQSNNSDRGLAVHPNARLSISTNNTRYSRCGVHRSISRNNCCRAGGGSVGEPRAGHQICVPYPFYLGSQPITRQKKVASENCACRGEVVSFWAARLQSSVL